MVLFHIVLIAAILFYNWIAPPPVPQRAVPADGMIGAFLTNTIIVLTVLVIVTEMWLRRMRRRLEEEHLRRLRLRAVPPPEHLLVSG